MTTTTGSSPLQSMRILAFALSSAPVYILIALWFVLGEEPDAWSPPLWALAVPLALGVGSAAMIGAVGYRAAALPVTTAPTEAGELGVKRYQSLMMLRFVLAELPMIVGLALGFVVEQGGFAVVATGCAVALTLMVWHVPPTATNIEKVRRSLAGQGAVVPLREALEGR